MQNLNQCVAGALILHVGLTGCSTTKSTADYALDGVAMVAKASTAAGEMTANGAGYVMNKAIEKGGEMLPEVPGKNLVPAVAGKGVNGATGAAKSMIRGVGDGVEGAVDLIRKAKE